MNRWQRIAAYGITAAAIGMAIPSRAQEVSTLVEKQLPDLLTTYKSINAAPELSHHEAQTSALLAGERARRATPSQSTWESILRARRHMVWSRFSRMAQGPPY